MRAGVPADADVLPAGAEYDPLEEYGEAQVDEYAAQEQQLRNELAHDVQGRAEESKNE